MSPPKLDPKIDKKATEILGNLPASRRSSINSLKSIDWDDCIRISYPGFKRWMNYYDRNVKGDDNKVASYEVESRWFQKEVSDILDGYKTTFTGKALLAEIRRGCTARKDHEAKRMTIYPFMRYGSLDDLNADVRLTDADAAAPDDHWGYEALYNIADQFNPLKKLLPRTKGVGANAIIEFSPDDWTKKVQRLFGPGMDPEAVLFHELVHGAGQMNGTLARRKIIGRGGKQDGFEDEAEFIAILITNMYMSETGDTKLRSTHGVSGEPLLSTDPFFDRFSYLKPTPRDMIARFKHLQLPFYSALTNIPKNVSAFNPLSTYNGENAAPVRRQR
jgi:hypothetical protein